MLISRKCEYALRAVFELALRNKGGPVRVREIAESQNIPPRFLEIILSQMRHGGFVESRRGNEGGYMLSRPAEELTVGEIIKFVQGPVQSVADGVGEFASGSKRRGDDVFGELWAKANHAVGEIFDETSIGELVGQEKAYSETLGSNYSI